MAVLAISSCKDNAEQEFDIHGVWELKNIIIGKGADFSYSDNSVPMKVYADSCYYVALKSSTPSGFSFLPTYKGSYKMINRGGDEWMYVEDGILHQLTVVSDSVISVQDVGRTYEWHRMDEKLNGFVDDIMNVAQQGKDSWGDSERTYVFSETERSLKHQNHALVAICLCVGLALAFLAYYTHNIYRNKKRMQQQLKQIREERDARPMAVKVALKNVEEEFLHSDFYLSLRRRISNGERLKKSDWDEIEQHVNSTYSGFVGRLFNLYPVSHTELQTCLLIKLGVPTTEIANTMCKSTSSISSIRSRLYTKVFNEKGSAKDWDDFILSL